MARRSKYVAIGITLSAIATFGSWPSAAAQQADAKSLRYGEHLAQECATCHRRDGVDNGIPSILGMRAEDFLTTMGFYQTGARDNQAMVSVAKSLDEDQVKALAAYFATLPKPPKRSSTSAAPSAKK